jgi:hypothetical protein
LLALALALLQRTTSMFAAIAATLLPSIDVGLSSLLIAAIAATLDSLSARFDLTSLCLLPSRSCARCFDDRRRLLSSLTCCYRSRASPLIYHRSNLIFFIHCSYHRSSMMFAIITTS